MNKTKVMMETDNYIKNTQIENFECYTYLGQRYSTRYKTQGKDIQSRVMAKHRDIYKGDIGTCLTRQVFPAMTYGAAKQRIS